MASPAIADRASWTRGKRQAEHPLVNGLRNYFTGVTSSTAFGNPIVSSTGAQGPTQWGAAQGGKGAGLANGIWAWSWSTIPTFATFGPLTLFAAIHLDSNSLQGTFVGINQDLTTDAGVHLCVGATAGDANGNNLVGLHGGVGWKPSGIAIGVGSHTVAMTDDTSGLVFYIDGARVATAAASAYSGTLGNPVFGIGAQNNTATGKSLATGARVAMAAAWSRVLTDAEIQVLHLNPFILVT